MQEFIKRLVERTALLKIGKIIDHDDLVYRISL